MYSTLGLDLAPYSSSPPIWWQIKEVFMLFVPNVTSTTGALSYAQGASLIISSWIYIPFILWVHLSYSAYMFCTKRKGAEITNNKLNDNRRDFLWNIGRLWGNSSRFFRHGFLLFILANRCFFLSACVGGWRGGCALHPRKTKHFALLYVLNVVSEETNAVTLRQSLHSLHSYVTATE